MTNLDRLETFLDGIASEAHQSGADEQAAVLQPVIDGLRADLATANSRIAELEAGQPPVAPGPVDPPPDPDPIDPPPVDPEPEPTTGLLIGARAKTSGSLTSAFDQAVADLGQLQVTRAFYGALPTKHTRISPAGVLEIISFKSAGDNLEAFLRSLQSGEQVAYYHEPEGPTDWPNGAAFVAAWDRLYDRAKAVRPDVQFGMIAGGYQYRANGGRGKDGSFIPARADFYAVDTYRDGSSEAAYGAIVPLPEVAEFMTWYGLVKGRGRPLMVTEYGRGVENGTAVPSTPPKRLAVLPQDAAWLTDHDFEALCLWYSDSGPDGRPWIPRDPEYKAAFRALPRG